MTTPSPSTRASSARASLLGALVADAAALGLHWIYDPERIKAAAGKEAAFTPLTPENYEGVPAYFAHGERQNGQQSQYGEILALAMHSLRHADGFDAAQYQAAYAAHFGSGGSYQGYIDKPTRGTLANLAAGQVDPSGVDDDQLPALAPLPALVAFYSADPNMSAHVSRAIKITHVNNTAEHYGQLFATCLRDVIEGTPLREALSKLSTQDEVIKAALETSESDPIVYGETTGRACHLSQGFPLAVHILTRCDSYASAIETNINAGGDSCGRAIAIGALAGAAYGVDAIPLHWILATSDARTHWDSTRALCPRA